MKLAFEITIALKEDVLAFHPPFLLRFFFFFFFFFVFLSFSFLVKRQRER